jgi:hypothetical protein
LGSFLKRAVAIAALGACGIAQAGLLNFEQSIGSPVFTEGRTAVFGDYWVESHVIDGLDGDLVGQVINGASAADICVSLSCPGNNKSNYYAGLADGYFLFGLTSNATFGLKSFKASFIGAGQTGAPAAQAGALLITAFDANGVRLAGIQANLRGPTADVFNFATFTTSSSFANIHASFFAVQGFDCSAGCSNAATLSNFGIDDIETVPEPTSIALLGLGLIGMGAAARRRAA